MLRGGAVWGFCGTTYFDFPTFSPANDEVFIDCGCYNGKTVFDFLNWCEGKYSKIYAFEPDANNFEICQEQLKDLKDITIIKVEFGKEIHQYLFQKMPTIPRRL